MYNVHSITVFENQQKVSLEVSCKSDRNATLVSGVWRKIDSKEPRNETF